MDHNEAETQKCELWHSVKNVITGAGESAIYGHWGWGDGIAFSWAGQEVLTKEAA